MEGRVVEQEPGFVSPVAVLLVQEEAELGEEQQEGQRGRLALVDGEEDPSVARHGGDDAYLRQPQGLGHQYPVFGLDPTPSAVVLMVLSSMLKTSVPAFKTFMYSYAATYLLSSVGASSKR